MESFCPAQLLLSLLMLCILSIAGSFTPNISYYIDCGSKTPITLSNENPARTFKADDLILSCKNSFALSNPNNTSTGSLYSTARVSSSNFKYSFSMEPNSSNVLRLHFLPFSAQSCDLSTAKFSVKAQNLYVLLENSIISDTTSPTIKEFFLWTYTSNLDVEFIPVKNSLAFVSAMEVFTAPKELLSDANPISIGTSTNIKNGGLAKQVLETMYRVNMPGPLITPYKDTLWRTWVTDDPYIYGAAVSQNHTVSMKLNYEPSEGSSEEIAPPIVYNTARVINTSLTITSNIKISWSFSVSSGYNYLIRLHFCDIISDDLKQGLVFTVYVMDYVALANLRLSNYTTKILQPFYIDFITHVKSAQNITVAIGLYFSQNDIFQYAFLNGLEIMKVGSNSNYLNGNKKILHIVVVIGASISVVIIVALVVASFKKRCQKPTQCVGTQLMWSPMTKNVNFANTSRESGESMAISALRMVNKGLFISFAEIKTATNNFDEKNVIGLGKFGKVYKGVFSDGTQVAVKRALSQSKQGHPEFQAEIEILSQILHRHLVSLIGYCYENSEMIIVYEYMEKGPLRNYLYGNEFLPLSWKQRLEICIQAAKGLHYLHTGYSKKIIHRDIKSTNILLGEGFVAKLSDFGLSKLGASMDETHVSTIIKGTFGYLDPEYFLTQQLTGKSDVYSFGVTLLEVLCARRVIDHSLPMEEINLPEWALMLQRQGQLEKVIDPRIVGEINENSLRKFWEIIERCIQDHVIDRPDIGDVLWNLEYCLQLQEMDLRREPYEDSWTSQAQLSAVPSVRRMPSSMVSNGSHATSSQGENHSDITNSQ